MSTPTFPSHGASPVTQPGTPGASPSDKRQNLFHLALRTQFTLWRRTWAMSSGQKIGFALFAVYALIGSAGALTMAAIIGIEQHSLSALGNALPRPEESTMPQTILDNPWTFIATFGLVGYIFLQIIMPSNEANVTPEKLAPYPLHRRQLAALTAPAILLQSRPLLALLIALITAGIAAAVGAHTGGAVIALLAFLGTLLSFVMILLLEQFISNLGAGSHSKARERFTSIAGMVIMLLFAGGGLILNTIGASGPSNDFPSWVGVMIDVLGWTFLTWTTAFEMAAAGMWSLTAVHIALGVVYLALLSYAWLNGLERRTLASSRRSANSTKLAARDSFYLRGFPHTVAGALASRQLYYWRRDRRWFGSFIFIGACLVIVSVLMGNSTAGNIPYWGIYLGFLTTFTSFSNPFGNDGPTNWVLMSAGVRARDVMRGYALAAVPVTIVAVALLTIPALITMSIVGLDNPDPLTVATMGASIVSPLIGLPFAFVSAVRAPFQTPPPGSSMWNMNSTGGNRQFLPLLVGALITAAIIAPQCYLVYRGVIPPWVVPVDVLTISIIAIVLAIRYASRRLEATWPEIFTTVRNWT